MFDAGWAVLYKSNKKVVICVPVVYPGSVVISMLRAMSKCMLSEVHST